MRSVGFDEKSKGNEMVSKENINIRKIYLMSAEKSENKKLTECLICFAP